MPPALYFAIGGPAADSHAAGTQQFSIELEQPNTGCRIGQAQTSRTGSLD